VRAASAYRLALFGIGVALATGCVALGLAPPDADPSVDVPTELSNYELGVEYPLRVGTHCGFQVTSIGGEWWVPVEPIPHRDNQFGFNATDGTVVVASANRATWTASNGLVVELRPWDENRDEPFPPCD
jgi:hypothetical protein